MGFALHNVSSLNPDKENKKKYFNLLDERSK